MIDAYTAAYASVSYSTQTTSLSLSVNQDQSGDDDGGHSGSHDDDYSFSLGYTSTTTVETYSLLVVQESRDFNSANEGKANAQQEKSALQTVLEGPTDPFDPIEGALAAFFSGAENDDDNKSEKGNGHKHGHDVRDNNYGHNKHGIEASYSVAQYQISTTTTTTELSLVA